MDNFLIIVIIVSSFLLVEDYLRKEKFGEDVFNFLFKNIKGLIKNRANANTQDDIKKIPNLFTTLSIVSFLIFLILSQFKSVYLEQYFIVFIGIFFASILVHFSFNFIFNHKATVKEFNLVFIIYGLIGLLLIIMAYYKYGTTNNFFTQLMYITIGIIALLIMNYIIFWIVALLVMMPILVFLYIITFLAKLFQNTGRYYRTIVVGVWISSTVLYNI